jgi:uncharacterized protein
MKFWLIALISLIVNANSFALDLPPLQVGINDFAGMFPPASADDLKERLHRFKTETAATVVVLTVKSLDGEKLESFGVRAFKLLPLDSNDLAKTALLVVARKEHLVGLQAGAELRPLLPEPVAHEKLQAQVALYWNGLFGVIRGDLRVGSQTEAEKRQDASLRGGEAGAIFAVCLAPFLALFVGGLWGIYATHYGFQRTTRLLMGAIFGGATAKLVAMLMSLLGSYGDNLWYFIMALAIPLGVFGSLTEFWMAGDWSGIPRVKERRRKPEDNMGI